MMIMALAGTMVASAATNPFFEYKNWKTPHGTYPFNEIHAEHYMPTFDEAMKRSSVYKPFERKAYDEACNLFKEVK